MEAVYETCDECLEDATESGMLLNETWFKFVKCECEEDFVSPDPGGLPGPTPLPKPDADPTDIGNYPGCPPTSDSDYCVRAFEDKPVYIPARFMPMMMESDCCNPNTGGSHDIPCVTPEGCDDPLAQCNYWKEPISYIRTALKGTTNCCLKSCTSDNNPDIVTDIPCGFSGPGEASYCHCLGLWTPWLLHSLEGGVQKKNCEHTPIIWNREDSIVLQYEYPVLGDKQRGCCQCCCGPACKEPKGNWDYCRIFEGMSTFDVVIEFTTEGNVSSLVPGLDHYPFPPDGNHLYPCPSGVQLLTYKFEVHPGVPDCIEAGGSEADCVPHSDELNVTDCMQLVSAGYGGIEPHCCETWDSPTDGDSLSGIQVASDETCTDCSGEESGGGEWQHILFRTPGMQSACTEAIHSWFPENPGECQGNPMDGDCTAEDDTPNPTDPPCPGDIIEMCDWCCNDNYIDPDQSGPCDDAQWGMPCCADTLGFCNGQAVYVTKKCEHSPGGTYGWQNSSDYLKWGHHSWCTNPKNTAVVGARIGFTHGGSQKYPAVSHGFAPAWAIGNDGAPNGCCTTVDTADNVGCHDTCGRTACDTIALDWGCGWTGGESGSGIPNCPYLFCFLLPDDRIDGETGECRPNDYVTLQSLAPEIPTLIEDMSEYHRANTKPILGADNHPPGKID